MAGVESYLRGWLPMVFDSLGMSRKWQSTEVNKTRRGLWRAQRNENPLLKKEQDMLEVA